MFVSEFVSPYQVMEETIWTERNPVYCKLFWDSYDASEYRWLKEITITYSTKKISDS